MLASNRSKYHYQFLSILLVVILVITLVPTNKAFAAASPVFNTTSKTILAGNTFSLLVKSKPANAKYSWSTSNKKVATVDKKGKVKAITKGKATISCVVKAASKTYTLKCALNVLLGATDITIRNKISYIKVGESYDLNRTLKPAFSNDTVTWTSSNTSIISPDGGGKFKAKKTGSAIITVTSSSGVSDSVTIYVVAEKEKTLTKSDVVNGQIVLSDTSIGNLTIDNSVGDIPITLTNVTVGGVLTMESGAAYTVTTNKCTINKVEGIQAAKLKNFALGNDTEVEKEPATPSLVAGSGSMIVSIDSQCNISIKQNNGATIQSFSVTTKADGSIQVSLEGFKGNLVIDSTSMSSIIISATACEISAATIKNATDGQAITFTDTNAGTNKESKIHAVNVEANATLTVDVKTEELTVAKDVNQADVVIQKPVAKLTNEGNHTSLTINSQVTEVTSTGGESKVSISDTAKVESLNIAGTNTNVELKSGAQVNSVTSTANNTSVHVEEGSTIQTVTTYGNNSSLSGSGRVQEAVVTGNNSEVNTEGTTVK
ncbi:MAG: Ig-like domain-containing protein, partial [Mobilitalea sp.]